MARVLPPPRGQYPPDWLPAEEYLPTPGQAVEWLPTGGGCPVPGYYTPDGRFVNDHYGDCGCPVFWRYRPPG